jgi:polyisoprenoid-binding protein YceI
MRDAARKITRNAIRVSCVYMIMIRFSNAILLGATTLLTASAPLSVERFVLDTNHTYIGFNVRHMMVTNVKGKFKNFSGEILLDEKDLTKSSANISIETASVDTDNERRDNHLRSDDFFNSAQFPAMTFKSTRVEKRGNQLTLVGNLTIRDVTKEVSIPFELTGPIAAANGGKRLGAEGALTINRFDYGLKYNRMAEAVAVVAPEVKIEINVEASTETKQ